MRLVFWTRPGSSTHFDGDRLHTMSATEANIATNRAVTSVGGLHSVLFLVAESDGYEFVAPRENASWCPSSRACRDSKRPLLRPW